jgi:hypothetical protein
VLASVTSATAIVVVVAATVVIVVVAATTVAIVVVAASCWRTDKLIKRNSEETRTESYMCLKIK